MEKLLLLLKHKRCFGKSIYLLLGFLLFFSQKGFGQYRDLSNRFSSRYEGGNLLISWNNLPTPSGNDNHSSLFIQKPGEANDANSTGYYNAQHNDKLPDGTFSYTLGPSASVTLRIFYEYGNGSGGETLEYYNSAYTEYKSPKLEAPTNVQLALVSGNFKITWENQTKYSSSFVRYVIKRKSGAGVVTYITTVDGDKRIYDDHTVLPTDDYTYTVQTILSDQAPSNWNHSNDAYEDAALSNTAPYYNAKLTADAEQKGKVTIRWPSFNNLRGIDGLILYRNGIEITDLSKAAKSYSDSEGLPGVYYKYTVGLVPSADPNTPPIDETYRTDPIEARSLPNGKISGYVKGKTNSGVPGIEVTAFSKTKVNDGKNTPNFVTSSGITGDDGYYEIPNLFYADETDFTVTPKMPGYSGKRFDPENLTRKLEIDNATQSQVNFTDTASFAISGKVYFAAFKDSSNLDIKLPLQDAEIWVNDKNTQTKTKADGSYSTTIINGGIYKVEAKYKNHKISIADNPAVSSIQKSVYSLVTGVDFQDNTTDTLRIKVAASCDAPIGEYAKVIITSKNIGKKTNGDNLNLAVKENVQSAAFIPNHTANQTERGVINLVLPATQYKVEVQEIRELDKDGNPLINSNKLEYFTREYTAVDADISNRDTVQNILKKQVIKTIPAEVLLNPDGTVKQIIKPARQDTTIKIDTTYLVKLKQVDFIYRKDLQVYLNNGNDVFVDSVFIKSANKYKYLLSQNDKVPLNVKIRESYSYKGITYNCTLDTGKVYIYDAISDVIDRQDFELDSTKTVKYQLKVGRPVIEAPYEKTIQIVGKVGGRQASVILTAIVQGERARNATFVTKTPEIPFFVLHDPPGDKSYATISKGTTISNSISTQYLKGGGGGAFADVKAGAGGWFPFIGSVASSIHVSSEIEAGKDKNSGTVTKLTTTFNESFSTSGEETLVGANGDVYVGASMNMLYALTDVLTYDPLKMDMKRDTSLAADYTGFNTTFVYTEAHIKNTLLNQLGTLYSISKNAYEVAKQKKISNPNSISDAALEQLNREQLENEASIKAWKSAVLKNANNRKNAKDRKLPDGIKGVVGGNISFSAGAIYDSSISVDADTTSIDEVSIYVNGFVRAGVFTKAGESTENDVGALATFRYNKNTNKEDGVTVSKTTSYHLEDNDLGDFFSVGLAEDKEYGTPVFKTISGSSSCPHEDNTQYRHLPAMQITGANEQRNVPADQAAKFQVLVANRSESDETVEYAIKLDPTSNPNGARVLVGGQDVTNGQATYYIPTGKNFTLPVEVFKGPLTSIYENLSLVIFSTCDNTLDDVSEANIAKPSVKINAYFQNACSPVDLFIPGNNWVVNQSNANKLFVAFSKYDASGSSPLTSVGLQYRKLNTDYDNGLWQTVITVPKKDLLDKYYDYSFDVSGIPDGNYQIRAIAVCQGVDVNYSPIYTGKIDRVSAVNFGVPSPKNGILTTADIIGVTFNKDIVYNDISRPIQVSLIRKDNGAVIPATIIGDGKNFQIKTVPESLISNYENVELVAKVKNLFDVAGNKLIDSVQWSFVVNLSPVYWSPNSVVVNAIENQTATFKTSLVNKSALNQNITLSKYPSWLTPSVKTGKIVPQGKLDLDFVISNALNTGTYVDTVVAVIDNKQQYLYVTVNVLRDPPNWTVNPQKFKYNMSFTAQFSLDQTDGLTSKDIRDKMGVFVGKECRGIANIEYDRDNDKYVAYITTYSNQATDEEMTVHFWDTYPGLEYQAKERLVFVANGNLGNLVNPYILHPEGIYQTIPLKKGWTWVSLNVQNNDMSLKNVLANLTPTEGDVIKTLSSNNAYSQYSKSLGWVGALNEVNLYNSYMIYVAKPDTIRILGNFINQAVQVKLVKGWSWAGYPMAINMDVNTYFKNFAPADGSQIISQEEFAQYNAGSKTWSGSLKYLRPGKGYKFYTETDGFTIPVIPYVPTVDPAVEIAQPITPPVNNPANPLVINNNTTVVNSTVNNTSVSTVNLENNMSVTSVINQGGAIVNNTTNRYETSIYVENKLVNIVNQVNLPNGNSVGFLPVNGNKTDEGKPVTIKVYDKTEKKEYTAKVSQPITQKTDGISGNILNPVQLILEGTANVKASNSISSARVYVSDVFTYQLKIENLGPDLAVNLNVKDVLPEGFDYVSSDGDLVYNASTRTLSASKLNLPNAAQQVYNIQLKANRVLNATLGNGNVTLNNDTDLNNNSFVQLELEAIDKRANEARLIIPSLFTPNGDGINDVFEIVGLNEFYKSNSLTIYNKGYNVVYRKDNYQNNWNGDSLPMGSYGYILKAVDKEGKEVVYKGFVTIVYQ